MCTYTVHTLASNCVHTQCSFGHYISLYSLVQSVVSMMNTTAPTIPWATLVEIGMPWQLLPACTCPLPCSTIHSLLPKIMDRLLFVYMYSCDYTVDLYTCTWWYYSVPAYYRTWCTTVNQPGARLPGVWH